MLLPLLLNLGCNNSIETLMYENYLWTCCNMWLVVLNHVQSWFVCRFVRDPSWFHRTTRFIWVQVWRSDRFGDWYCTCALINWTVLLQRRNGRCIMGVLSGLKACWDSNSEFSTIQTTALWTTQYQFKILRLNIYIQMGYYEFPRGI